MKQPSGLEGGRTADYALGEGGHPYRVLCFGGLRVMGMLLWGGLMSFSMEYPIFLLKSWMPSRIARLLSGGQSRYRSDSLDRSGKSRLTPNLRHRI